jgi:hypothetical protein
VIKRNNYFKMAYPIKRKKKYRQKSRVIGTGLTKKEVALVKRSNPRHKISSYKTKKGYSIAVGVKRSPKGNIVYDFKK